MNESSKIIETLQNMLRFGQYNNVDNVINSLKERFIFIYGAGSFGKEIYKLLAKYSLRPFAFLDINADNTQQIYGIPVFRADDHKIDTNAKINSVVLLSIVTRTDIINEITDFIKNCGFINVIDSQSIRAQFVCSDDCNNNITGTKYYLYSEDKINRVARIWNDEESLSIYKANIVAHITRNYESCPDSSKEVQYFPQSIHFNKGYSRFIDCGGYIGDTLENLIKTNGDIDTFISFEPDNDNFVKLSTTAEKLKSNIKQIILFPCALSNKTETQSFDVSLGSGQISAKGDSYVQCVALDDSIKNFSPTFIKMDVEGAELRALEGCKKLIWTSRPDLAICVYHCINHIWDIPILLDDWDLGYKFYLRTYSSCTMETVLYATTINESEI